MKVDGVPSLCWDIKLGIIFGEGSDSLDSPGGKGIGSTLMAACLEPNSYRGGAAGSHVAQENSPSVVVVQGWRCSSRSFQSRR